MIKLKTRLQDWFFLCINIWDREPGLLPVSPYGQQKFQGSLFFSIWHTQEFCNRIFEVHHKVESHFEYTLRYCSIWLEPSKGQKPARSSKRMTPQDQMSAALPSYFWLTITCQP